MKTEGQMNNCKEEEKRGEEKKYREECTGRLAEKMLQKKKSRQTYERVRNRRNKTALCT